MFKVTCEITVTKDPHVYVSVPYLSSKVYISGRLNNTIVRCYLHGPSFGDFCFENIRPGSQWVVNVISTIFEHGLGLKLAGDDCYAELSAFSTYNGQALPVLRITDVRSLMKRTDKNDDKKRGVIALDVARDDLTPERKLAWLSAVYKLPDMYVTYNDGVASSVLKKGIATLQETIKRSKEKDQEETPDSSAEDNDDNIENIDLDWLSIKGKED